MVNPADPNSIPKFVDPVPIPAVLEPVATEKGRPLYDVRIEQFQQRLHRDFPLTTVWGYNGTYPGPTLEVESKKPVRVWYRNLLPQTHLLPVVTSLHGAGPFRPEVRAVTHLHGGNTPPQFDGHPDAWWTPDLGQVGPMFSHTLFEYPNNQPAATLWYHDHAIGITRLNVYAGLAGFYLIRDKDEQRLPLPRGRFEVPLVIQDKSFNADGSLAYPAAFEPEFFGSTIVVNGKLWPFLEVEPRRYRFRLLNGSNARFYRLRLDPSLPVFQIGSDQGLLEQPVVRTEILLGPAERADVIIDFTGRAETTFTITNTARTPFPGGDEPSPDTRVIMQFRVNQPLSGPDESEIPEELTRLQDLDPKKADKTRFLTLNERIDDPGRIISLLGTRSPTGVPQPHTWGDATTEMPKLNQTEIWNLINTTGDTHPIHPHLVRFQVLDRRPFDVDLLENSGTLDFTGPPVPAPPYERGYKDTVLAGPGEVTRIIARFADFTGPYVWHCHILEHEDHEMMRRFEVIK